MIVKNSSRRVVALFFLLHISLFSFSQRSDSLKAPAHFGGAVTITNKGISLIPNLTLGKPAAIFDMSVGKGKLSFEPQFRFSLQGKPWTFIFWLRYEMLKTDKFQFKIGAHPAYAFSNATIIKDGVTQEITRAQRYLAGELAPNYFLTKNISIGVYYLYAHGLEEDLIQNTHYLALRCNLSNIRLSDQFYLKFYPQVYYLKMDKNDGYYFNSVVTLAKKNFPLTVSTLLNRTIKTNIPVGEDFVWNISLSYTFNKQYRKI